MNWLLGWLIDSSLCQLIWVFLIIDRRTPSDGTWGRFGWGAAPEINMFWKALRKIRLDHGTLEYDFIVEHDAKFRIILLIFGHNELGESFPCFSTIWFRHALPSSVSGWFMDYCRFLRLGSLTGPVYQFRFHSQASSYCIAIGTHFVWAFCPLYVLCFALPRSSPNWNHGSWRTPGETGGSATAPQSSRPRFVGFKASPRLPPDCPGK